MYDYNSNLAYDLSLFEIDEEEERRKAQKRAEKNTIKMAQKKEKAVARNGSVLMSFTVVVLVVVIAFAILYSKVQLSDYTAMISEIKTELQLTERENLRLNAELDSMVTLDNVETIASEELGLQKTQNSQVVFVPKNTEKMTEIAETDGNIFVSIKDWFYGILEYLGF